MTRSRLYLLGLCATLLAGLFLRFAGLTEEFRLHPDERKIADWMDRYHNHIPMPKVYPGGFFVLADAARKTYEWTVFKPLHRWAYFTRQTDQFNSGRPDPIRFGRPFNAALGTLGILLAALLARRVTRSRAGALLAAFLMAFAALPIEHAHYLETDIAMLVTLTLALFLLARAVEKRTAASLALAALAAGFAAGTKFPLALLLVPLLATAGLQPRPAALPRPRWPRRLGFLLLALLLGAAGFVLALPEARHLGHFLEGVRGGTESAYFQTSLLLGEHRGEPHAREWMNAANMVRFARTLGAGWLLAAALGLPLCLQRRWRPYWPVTLLFPAAFLWFIVFHAPWSRSQEFMTLVPDFCLWAALPVAALWNLRRWPRAGKGLALALVAAAALPAARMGTAVSSQFAWEDTRRLANRQLKIFYPADQDLGTERYTSPAEEWAAARAWDLDKIESVEPEFLRTNAIHYVLRNVDAHGRGILDPITGRLFPLYAARMEHFLRNGQRLAAWGALDSPAPQPAFRSPDLELWSRPADSPLPHEDIGVELPRPSLVQDEGRTTWFLGKLGAGPRFTLLLDKNPREIAIGGPGDFSGPVFLVVSTRERAAAVRAHGFGRTGRLDLPPYDAGVIPLQRPWWNPRWTRFEYVVVRTQASEPDITYLPCYLRIAFDPVEAATLLLDEGHPDKAVALLRAQNALASAGPFWQALAETPEARPAAAALLAKWDEWLARDPADPPALLSGGIRLDSWQDFARIRLVTLGTETNLHLLQVDAESEFRQTAPLARILPVLNAPQRLDLALGRAPDAFGNTNFSGFVHLMADDRSEITRYDFLSLPDARTGDTNWSATLPSFPRSTVLSFRSRSGGAVRVENAEFTWNWRDMLAVRRAQLDRALAPRPAPAPLRYGDWVALRSCRVDNGAAVLEFEALQDDVPPLGAQLRIRRHVKWLERTTVPLNREAAAWRAGERRTVRLPLLPGQKPDRTGIAVVTDLPWHAATVPLAGAPAKRPFPTLADISRMEAGGRQ